MTGNWEIPQHIHGLKPWACSYDGPDGRYAITLYSSDPQRLLEDNCDALPGLAVDGELLSRSLGDQP